MTRINSFASLIEAAREQPEPQRLLFVFARPVLPDDHQPEQAERFRQGQGGALQPLMCVDREPAELSSLEALAAEAPDPEQDWQVVLVAAISGQAGRPPSDDDATRGLNTMIKTIHAGGDLSGFVAFDRDGLPLRFE